MAADVARAVREAAALAASIELVRTILPATETFFAVAAFRFLSALHLGHLTGLVLQFMPVRRSAKAAYRHLGIAMLDTEVATADYTLGRRSAKTDCNWTFTF
ncbi:MAG: hypothetical protein IVW55_04335 [Chloroflexi bacterium]|nr:hypothetical protein [Chloroflexota bacterium]